MKISLIVGIVSLVAALAVFGMAAKPGQGARADTELGEAFETRGKVVYPTQTKTMGTAQVHATPASVTADKDTVITLEITDASPASAYDFRKIATLTDSRGYTFRLLNWIGNSQGSHIRGQLVFPPIPEDQDDLTLTLTGVNNADATFVWR